MSTSLDAQTNAADRLLCSVIVPVYNGAEFIVRCLRAFACQSIPPPRYELIVVDDGSTDGTAALVEQWMAAHPGLCCTLVQQENAGPAAARNRGALAAHAPLLLFTDADCAPTHDWIARMTAAFEDPTVVGAKGTYLTEQSGIVSRFVQAEYEDRYDRMRHLDRIDFIDTYSAAYRRDLFLENGGFDAVFTTASVEDQELSFRLAQKGYRMVFVADAQVVHLHDSTVADYFWRKYYIGFWKALLVRWHPERVVQDSHTPQILKVQMTLWALILAVLPLALGGFVVAPFRLAWIGEAVLLTIFLLTTVPFIRKLRGRSQALTLVGPLLLVIRSVALGAGYLIGTIHFAGTLPGERQPVIPGWKRLMKRGLDVVGALMGLALSVPLIAVAAVAIKLESTGPVFYRQLRIGEHGRPFCMVKLRSMVHDAEMRLPELVNLDALPEPAYKLTNDPRVTRIGRILRRTSLDETPQFINVLRGEMSLVGPRPEEASVVARYDSHQRRRLAVKPGMTGPMQVNGRGNLSFSERLRLELEYIDHYSLRRDLAILLRTFETIWRGHGAY